MSLSLILRVVALVLLIVAAWRGDNRLGWAGLAFWLGAGLVG